jgi:hypothetical protein
VEERRRRWKFPSRILNKSSCQQSSSSFSLCLLSETTRTAAKYVQSDSTREEREKEGASVVEPPRWIDEQRRLIPHELPSSQKRRTAARRRWGPWPSVWSGKATSSMLEQKNEERKKKKTHLRQLLKVVRQHNGNKLHSFSSLSASGMSYPPLALCAVPGGGS